ncbi:hypothetical protein DK853_33080, partial [Klebsiella oxytoca]
TAHCLDPGGYRIVNYLTNESIRLRLRTEQLLSLQKWLTDGVYPEELVFYLAELGMNGSEVMNDWIRKGIIE